MDNTEPNNQEQKTGQTQPAPVYVPPQNLPKSPAPQQSSPNPGLEKTDQPVGEEYLFFNVMPKATQDDKLTEPTLKIKDSGSAATDQPNSKPGFMGYLKNHKLYVIIALIILIGGPLGYFIINKLASDSYQTEDFLVKRPGQPGAKTATTGQPAGFTTSQAWRDKYFPSCQDASLCGDNADPDHDGLNNLEESKANTDPNNPDSDKDGLSDGDEVKVFGSDPLNAHTAGNPKYSDADNIRGGYDPRADGKKMTSDQIAAITKNMQAFGLHEPTLSTEKDALQKVYGFSTTVSGQNQTASSTPSTASSSLPSNLDTSPQAKQDRDAQRSNTMKNIETALVAYQKDKGTYPQSQNFVDFSNIVRPYLKVATNFVDPINVSPYVYVYTANSSGSDFILSFYSETQNQLIKKTAADAQKDAQTDQANLYDNQRKSDLEMLRSTLLVYSSKNISGTQNYVFPTVDKYKTALVPDFISSIPKDPKTGKDYEYQVSATFDTFTLKAVLDNPSAGTTGYLCNQEECRNY